MTKKPLQKKALKDTRVRRAVQKYSDARRAKTEKRGVYRNTSSDEGCSASVIRRIHSADACPAHAGSVFQQPVNVIITGVGGQGNVLASRVLAGMLVSAGYFVTIGETFGMSQRGGSVMSHLRISEKSVLSPQIPGGRVDIIIALEPVEALRVLTKYGNPRTVVLANEREVYPIGVITGELGYPSREVIKDKFDRYAAKNWFIDATAAAVELGNPILSNIIMVGALSATKQLPIDRRAFAGEIKKDMSADKQKINLAAFDAGVGMI